MNGEDVPRCVGQGCDPTVKHILIECRDLAEDMQRYYDAENIGQLFYEISVTEDFYFLWEMGLFYRI